jgi:hypothetical protein
MQPADHPWHRALWFAIKYVDDENFWEEVAPYGVQRHTGPPAIEGPDVAGRTTLEGTLRWTRPDQRSAAFEERRRLTHVPLGEDAYAIDLDTTLTAVRAATIRSEPFTTWGGYGGLSLRGRSDWHDTRLLLADGSVHDRVIGVASPWCDLSGPVGEGSLDVGGVAILDHPGNRRSPVPWYGSTRAATYGDDGLVELPQRRLPLPRADRPRRRRAAPGPPPRGRPRRVVGRRPGRRGVGRLRRRGDVGDGAARGSAPRG